MKNLKLILHIGSGKTGTTALQSFLRLNQKLLHQEGIHYMEAPIWGDNSHHLLGFALWGTEHLGLPNIPEVHVDDLLNKMAVELSNLPENIHAVIISTELLFEIAGNPKIKPLKDFIQANFTDTKIVAYLRRQDEHIQSLYQHWVKTGHKQFRSKTIAQFIEEFKGDNYYEKLCAWANEFNKESIIVKIYEKQQFKNGNLFDDFMEILSVDDISNFSQPKKDNLNLSINPEATEILRLCGFYDYNQLKEIWPDATKTNLTGYSLLSAKQKLKVLEKFEESNRKVAIDFLRKEDGNLFSAPSPSEAPMTVTNNTMPFEFMVPTLMSIFQNQHQQILKLEQEVNRLEAERKNLHSDLTNLSNKINNPLNHDIIYVLNKNNFNAISYSNHISSYSWKSNELEIIASDSDPGLYFNVPLKINKSYLVKLIIHSSVETITQLFYSLESEEGFKEKHSISVKSKAGLNEHIFNLDFKNLSPKLRIDPSNSEGKFTIKTLLINEK